MDGMDELFQPDVMTPGQFADSRRSDGSHRAERRLLFAAFRVALQDCRQPVNTGQYHASTRERWRREALEWLRDDFKGIGSCAWFCEALGIEIGALRKALSRESAFLPPLPRAEPRAARAIISRGRYNRRIPLNGGETA